MRKQQERVLKMLKAAPGPVSYEALSLALDKKPTRNDKRRRLSFVVCRVRKLLSPGEHIENYRNFAYHFVAENQPRAR